MVKTQVTSIRINSELIEKANAFGLNVSKLTEEAITREINKMMLKHNIIPQDLQLGLSKKSRVLLDNDRFKDISKLKIGDKVVSYNEIQNKLEPANVIDVGPLTDDKAFAMQVKISTNTKVDLEVLKHTPVFCSKGNLSTSDWVKATDIIAGFSINNVSRVKAQGFCKILNVLSEPKKDDFYKLEVYPNNTFIANSNPLRKTRYLEDYPASVWGLPVKGYPGEIGLLLEPTIARAKI